MYIDVYRVLLHCKHMITLLQYPIILLGLSASVNVAFSWPWAAPLATPWWKTWTLAQGYTLNWWKTPSVFSKCHRYFGNRYSSNRYQQMWCSFWPIPTICELDCWNCDFYIATFFSNITAPDFEELAFALGTLLTWVESHTMAVDWFLRMIGKFGMY